jgi:hypothetical protein
MTEAQTGLQAIGEIVHDIDLNDGKFGREEATGIAHLVAGIATANHDEEQKSSGTLRAVRSSRMSTSIFAQGAGDPAAAVDGQKAAGIGATTRMNKAATTSANVMLQSLPSLGEASAPPVEDRLPVRSRTAGSSINGLPLTCHPLAAGQMHVR